jgi:hypothetical protein
MRAPTWKLVAQLGDENPLEYGGYFVYIDETGAYTSEAEYLIEMLDGTFTAYRFILEPCISVNGVLSDNPYHPETPVWFDKDIDRVSESCGIDLIPLFCTPDPVQRAIAWREVGEYYGFENLDNYPLTLTKKEAKKRYGI